jgi:hypothetical protein
VAKRGQLRPWKRRYEWPNGIAGTDAFVTQEDARDAGRRIARHVSPADGVSRPTVTVWHRDRPDEVETIPNPPIGEDE